MKYMKRGFTIIELMVVMGILAMLSTMLLLNFRSSGTSVSAQNQAASAVASDIRRMQSLSLAGSLYNTSVVCGYGVHYLDATSYRLFARTLVTGSSCVSGATLYQAADKTIEDRKIVNSRMSFSAPFADVYFEVPYGKTYTNGNGSLVQAPLTIGVIVTGQAAPIVTIKIYTSGKIDVSN